MKEKAEDAKEPREAEDIPAFENAEEPDCAAQVVTEELTETAEIDAAQEPMMEKAEDAEEPREAAQTAVEDIR